MFDVKVKPYHSPLSVSLRTRVRVSWGYHYIVNVYQIYPARFVKRNCGSDGGAESSAIHQHSLWSRLNCCGTFITSGVRRKRAKSHQLQVPNSSRSAPLWTAGLSQRRLRPPTRYRS